jgi:hypothetical protein
VAENKKVGDKYSLLKSLATELSKNYIILDGQGRISLSFSAMASAKSGDPALVTEYIYVDAASTVIKARKESNGTWDEDSDGWDAEFTT